MRKSTRTILAVSLIMNILFIGIFIGYFIRVTMYPAHPPKIDIEDYGITGVELQRIHDQLHDVHVGNRATFGLIQEEKERALQILRSEPFDEAAYQASIDRIQKLRSQAVQYVTDNVKNIVPGLSERERAVLAEILRHPPPPPRE